MAEASIYECSQLCGWQSKEAPLMERCNACGHDSTRFKEFCSQCGAQDFSSVCPACDSTAVCDHPDAVPNATVAHHEHCDTLDPIIRTKPCNCMGFAAVRVHDAGCSAPNGAAKP
jgi:hypothetical protein